jgi:hypothetical protein
MRTKKEVAMALAVTRLVHAQVQQIPIKKLNAQEQIILERDRMWTEEEIKILEWIQGDNNRFEDAIQAWKRKRGWK